MTARVGLLGWPVAHSVSPPMHNAAFDALGLDWRYDRVPVPPEELEGTIARLVAEGWRGFNVTIPHKQAVMRHPLVSSVSAAAGAIGAGNTLVVGSDGSLHVDNTDWRGFLDDLRAHGVDVSGAACVILGTGGSARAVRYALEQAGAAQVTGVSRTPGDGPQTVGYADLPRLVERAALVVNCTPLGMWPAVDGSPWPEGAPIPPHLVVVDLVYNPPHTRLMRQAEDAGARAIGGLGMLVRQGAHALAAWTGVAPPLDVMAAAARAALDGHQTPSRQGG